MEHLAAQLAAIPGVVAVTLGGSRATNTAVQGSGAAQGRLAAAGEWVLNEKGLVARAGLGSVQDRLGRTEGDLGALDRDVRACLAVRDAVWADE